MATDSVSVHIPSYIHAMVIPRDSVSVCIPILSRVHLGWEKLLLRLCRRALPRAEGICGPLAIPGILSLLSSLKKKTV